VLEINFTKKKKNYVKLGINTAC